MTDPQMPLTLGQQTNALNGKKIVSKIIDYWYLYLISLLICLSYAWFKVHYATPMYKVYGQVLVQDDKNSGGTSQALAGNGGGMDFNSLFSGKVNMANEMAILQTTDLCKQVVKNLSLYTSYYHKGSVRVVELYYKGSPFHVNYNPFSDTIIPVSLGLKFSKVNQNEFTVQAGEKTFPWHFGDTLLFGGARYYFTKKQILT